MDRWRKLRAKYRDQGLRIVMVHTQDPDTQCGQGVSDFADDVICDPKGYVANWLRVRKALPAAFLWSWQGNMLALKMRSSAISSGFTGYRFPLMIEMGKMISNYWN